MGIDSTTGRFIDDIGDRDRLRREVISCKKQIEKLEVGITEYLADDKNKRYQAYTDLINIRTADVTVDTSAIHANLLIRSGEGLGNQLYAATFAQEARLVELQRRLSHYSWLEPDPIVVSSKMKVLQVFEVEKSWDA